MQSFTFAAIAEEVAETFPVPTAGILLFPTVLHIAESPSGRGLSLLRSAPLLDRHAHCIAKAAADAAPDWALGWALRRVLGFSEHAFSGTAVDVGKLVEEDIRWRRGRTRGRRAQRHQPKTRRLLSSPLLLRRT